MRFVSIVLAVVAASEAHLKSPLAVSGLPITYVDDPEPANINSDAVSAQRDLEALDKHNSEERAIISNFADLSVEAKAAVRLMHVPDRTKLFETSKPDVLRAKNWFVKLLYHIRFIPNYQEQLLQLYESAHGVGSLVNKLMKATESKDDVIRKYAGKLLDGLSQRWMEKEISVDGLYQSLKLFGDSRIRDRAVDYRKIKALGLYIDRVNKHKKSHHTLIGTLTKNYGDKNLLRVIKESFVLGAHTDYAGRLLYQMMKGWKKKNLSVSEVFGILHLREAGKTVFRTFDFVVFEQYVKHFKKGDVLSDLTEAFGDELKLAEFAAEAFGYHDSPKAGEYLDALLQRWKGAGLQPDELEAGLLASQLANSERGASSLLYYYSKLFTEATVVEPAALRSR